MTAYRPVDASTSARRANAANIAAMMLLDARSLSSASSIVAIRPTGMSASTSRTAARIALAASAPRDVRTSNPRLRDGRWAAGTYTAGSGGIASSGAAVSPATPTTVSQTRDSVADEGAGEIRAPTAADGEPQYRRAGSRPRIRTP